MYSDSVYNGSFSFFMPNYVNKDKGVIPKKNPHKSTNGFKRTSAKRIC